MSCFAVDVSAMLVEDWLSSFGWCVVVLLTLLLFSDIDIGVLVFCWCLIMLSEMSVIFLDCNFSAICWKYSGGGCGESGLSRSLDSCSNCCCNFFGWSWFWYLGVKSLHWFLVSSCFECCCWFVCAENDNLFQWIMVIIS